MANRITVLLTFESGVGTTEPIKTTRAFIRSEEGCSVEVTGKLWPSDFRLTSQIVDLIRANKDRYHAPKNEPAPEEETR